MTQRASNGRTVRSAKTAESDAEEWTLRVAHLSYRQIGERLGMTGKGAWKACERHARAIPGNRGA